MRFAQKPWKPSKLYHRFALFLSRHETQSKYVRIWRVSAPNVRDNSDTWRVNHRLSVWTNLHRPQFQSVGPSTFSSFLSRKLSECLFLSYFSDIWSMKYRARTLPVLESTMLRMFLHGSKLTKADTSDTCRAGNHLLCMAHNTLHNPPHVSYYQFRQNVNRAYFT